jgi:Fic family protein
MDYRLDENQLTQPLVDLEQRRWLFEKLPLDPTHADWFRHRAWIRTIHGTTRIEGNTLNDLEVEEVLASSSSRFSRKDALEVLGTRAALSFVDETAGIPGVLADEPLVREIHRRVLDDINPLLTPGAYRRGSNMVVGADGRTVFTSPPSGDVPDLMRQFGLWLRTATERHGAPVVAALAHLELVAIHPFYDGNGRTSRALARFFLLGHGYGFGGLVSLDAQLDHERTTYFQAIRRSTRRTYRPPYDATPFVLYFLGAIVRAADRVLARIGGLGQVMIAVRRDIARKALPAPLLDGLAYAWVNHSLRPADYIRITGRSPQSTTRDLAAAVTLGYLEPRGEKRGRWYALGLAFKGTTVAES